MKTYITAIATANPPYARSQAEASLFVANLMNLHSDKRQLLERVFTNSGIERRHSVLEDYTKLRGDFAFFPNTENVEPFPSTGARMQIYQREALPLALAAIHKLPGLAPRSITHLITISCTGMYTPGIDIELVQRLGLAAHTQRTAINFMGCYGAFNGLKVADAICRAHSKARVLMVCVELCSLHLQKDPSMANIISSVLFADGAAAAIIQAQVPSRSALALENFYCDLIPNTHEDMSWQIGDTGFDMVLSGNVPKAVQASMLTFCEKFLAQHDTRLADLDYFAIHPGGRKVLEACETALGISKADNRYAYEVLKNFGNMSSTTVLFVLEALWRDRKAQDHQKKILSLGLGPGLTLESMLLNIHYPTNSG